MLATAVWAYVLLDRTPDWLPWLRWVIVIAGRGRRGGGARRPVSGGLARAAGSRGTRRALVAVPLGLAMVAGLAGPTAYALDTVNTSYTGAIVSAGPQSGAGFGGGPAAEADSPAARAGQFGRGTGGARGGTAFGGPGAISGTGGGTGTAVPAGTARPVRGPAGPRAPAACPGRGRLRRSRRGRSAAVSAWVAVPR